MKPEQGNEVSVEIEKGAYWICRVLNLSVEVKPQGEYDLAREPEEPGKLVAYISPQTRVSLQGELVAGTIVYRAGHPEWKRRFRKAIRRNAVWGILKRRKGHNNGTS